MLSRRAFCIEGLASAVVPLACCANETSPSRYRSTLVNGYTPVTVDWSGRTWRCNMGSTWRPDMDHCLQLAGGRARCEVRDSPYDHSRADEPAKRRSEISGSLRGDPARLPNDVPLWSAMSFIHHGWSDPAGMARLTGGIHGQVHMGHGLGGSPAVAFRRTADGAFSVTTRGENAPRNNRHYAGPLAFGRVHDLVWRMVLHPTAGSLAVWVDGKAIVNVQGASIGSRYADSYWNLGCYYAGGVTCPVVAEFANHIYPGPAELHGRIAQPPAWPSA